MSIKRTQKKKLIEKHRTHKQDTGSSNVQVALLTKGIDLVTKHLKTHKKDHAARRGLLGMVAKRRTLLRYLQMHAPKEYQKVLEKNELKK